MHYNEQYQVFMSGVTASKTVWGLKASDGWAAAPSNDFEDRQVMPFWSDRDWAKMVAVEKWPTSEPSSIKLDDFVNLWLKSMHEDGVLVGVNWNTALIGKEIEPLELEKMILEVEKI